MVTGTSKPMHFTFVLLFPVGIQSVFNTRLNEISNVQLRVLSEKLWNEEINNHPRPEITLNLQKRTFSRSRKDEANRPLFQNVNKNFLSKPSVQTLFKLFDNYDASINIQEYTSADEKLEINAFLETIINTSIISILNSYLQQKDILRVNQDIKDLLRELWFTTYPRQKNLLTSSGFEHVFIGEIRNSTILGFHNWLHYYFEELNKNIDYRGWIYKVALSETRIILKQQFTWKNNLKAAGTMFVGTSPEFEIAIYTICFLAYPDNSCPISINNKLTTIITHTYWYQKHITVGSAYPEI